ncbi:hypothetical protein [Alkalibacter mobilis]|uniref:hypothetical protein n=1 Tax=Alkalibacter mobilis TaxID=2787712 RepID=UPI00189ECAB4|nr:hypothetical protein [Alkalibacter mobilis]MBF7096681.1 hypothetical protein [Alkalibacter mobilis]
MFNVSGYAKVFGLDRQEKFIKCNLSTSKKNKRGEYEYMQWRGRIVGNAVDKMQDINEGDVIKIENAIAESYYVKEKRQAFTSIVIFDLAKPQKRPQ